MEIEVIRNPKGDGVINVAPLQKFLSEKSKDKDHPMMVIADVFDRTAKLISVFNSDKVKLDTEEQRILTKELFILKEVFEKCTIVYS